MTGILLVGGTGVFGRLLAEGLMKDGHSDLIIAGRNLDLATEVANALGCRAAQIDRDGTDLQARLLEIAPEIVIDAAGPFQAYGQDPYRLARAAIAVGAHVMDLADDAAFVAGISSLDDEAKTASVVVRSGVSSVPCLSSAVVRDLSKGLHRTERIDIAILPGNRAPRGRSVMAAILAQVGKPIPGWDGAYGWIGHKRISVPGSWIDRAASPIGAPDLLLFKQHFGAEAVRFRAGLELPFLHFGLALIAWLCRTGALKSPTTWLPLLHRIARLTEPFGTDVGAMVVTVIGQKAPSNRVRRDWSVVARAGKGPYIPTLAARCLVRRLTADTEVATGARPALDDVTTQEVISIDPDLALETHTNSSPWPTVFETALGRDFNTLPDRLQDLHDVTGRRVWNGQATITRSANPFANLVANLFRFPKSGKDQPITVTMVRDDGKEVWTRTINGRDWVSCLTPDVTQNGRVWERFGPFRFAIDLTVANDGLHYPVFAGKFLGLPLPRLILPKSETREAVDEAGRATFDVALSLPFLGPIVRYEGWLQPISGDQSPSPSS